MCIRDRNSAVNNLRSGCAQTCATTCRVDRSSLRVVDDDGASGSATGVYGRDRCDRFSAMKAITLAIGISLLACGNAEEEGRRAAQAKAAAETKQEVASQAAVKISPPVPGRAHIPCTQLIDTTVFGEALAEVEPLRVTDITQTDAEAAAVCALIRGGVRPDPKQQAEMIK